MRIFKVFCGVFACLFLIASAGAQNVSRTPIVVGFNELRPYSFTDSMGRVQGFSIDILRQITEQQDVEFEFVSFNNPGDMLGALTQGDIDVTTLLAITQERELIGQFVSPIGDFETAAFTLRASAYTDAATLSGTRVGATSGSFSLKAAERIPFAEIVSFPAQQDVLLALLDGRIDALIAPTEMFRAQLNLYNLNDLIHQPGPALTQVPRSFLVGPQNTALVTELNAAIDAELRPSDLQELHHKWFGSPSTSNGLNATTLLLGVALAVVTTLLLILRLKTRPLNRPFTNDRNNRLLIEALNKIDLCIVIYDSDFKAVHWNEATAFTFPKLLPHLRRGAKMIDMISFSYQAGITSHRKTSSSAQSFARQIIEDIMCGKDTLRVVKMSDGRIFEAVEFAFGTDLYASLRKDVTKDQLQAQKIQDQNVKLAVVNERMQHFAEMAAHDLRAPLHHQSTLLDFVAEDLSDANISVPAEVSEYIDMSRTSLNRMLRLVEDLLEYARCDTASVPARSVDLTQRFDDVLQLIPVPKGFSVTRSDHLPRVHIPEAAGDIVLRNLISNAIKHHDKPTGNIHVHSEVVGNWAHILIQDDGPGIPDVHKTRIFKPFEQLSSGASAVGSGLGLSMVARTVEAWGGEISVENAPGGGSLFRVSAPLPLNDSVEPTLRLLDASGTGTG